MSKQTLCVVSPVFREAESISLFHDRLTEVLAGVSERYEHRVLYVVDPAGDHTVDVLRKIAERDPTTSVLVMSKRFGHQMALVAGLDHCDDDVIVMLDSDLQHPPELIATLLDRYEEGYDVVQTVRTSTEQQRRTAALASRLFYRIINRMSEVEIIEGGADFRLLSRRVATVFQHDVRERNQFLRGLVPWVGFKSTEVEFVASARAAGSSNYSVARSMKLAVDGLVSFSKTPLRFGIGLGLFFAFASFAYAMVSLVVWMTAGDSPSGWTSLAVLVAGLSGVLLVFMGVLGLYIGAIFDEVKARPHYVVDERINR